MLHHLDRHILEFVGSNIQAGGETIQGGKVGEIGANKFGEVADGRFVGGIEKTETQTERITRQGHHATELPRAQDADHPALSRGSGWSRTFFVCSAR